MTAKEKMSDWIVGALEHHGGSASIVDVAKHIWEHHEPELRASGDYFYKWQYQMRWDAQRLRDEGHLAKGHQGQNWALLR